MDLAEMNLSAKTQQGGSVTRSNTAEIILAPWDDDFYTTHQPPHPPQDEMILAAESVRASRVTSLVAGPIFASSLPRSPVMEQRGCFHRG